MPDLTSLANEQYCYLTTTGRVSGLPCEIEIWFGYGSDATIYMLSGGRDRSNWIRNLMKEPAVSVRIADQVFGGQRGVVDESSDEDQLARKLLVEKYEPIEGRSLANWGKTALPVAVELEVRDVILSEAKDLELRIIVGQGLRSAQDQKGRPLDTAVMEKPMPTEHVPERIDPKSLDEYLEVQSKPVFQAGMSWRVVESKWPDIREAMQGFQVGAVAAMGDEQIDALADDTRMIRSRRKIAAIVHNAQKLIDLDEKHSGIRNYLRSFDTYDTLAKDIKKQFKYMGEMGIYYWLYATSEEAPSYEEYQARQAQMAKK